MTREINSMTAKEIEELKFKKARKQLVTAIVLCFIFMGAETAGGIISHSLAILTEYVVS